MPHTTPMSEIREAAAPPDIAAIYADIRQATALPQVNLIFRHLATRPGILDWVWQTLRPLYVSDELAEVAARLPQSLPNPDTTSPIPAALRDDARRTCLLVLETYNSGNTQNLIALTTFVHLLDGIESGNGTPPLTPRSATPDDARTPRTAITFPPIPPRTALPPAITKQLDRLAARHRTAPGVIPSLYVHLALWPDILPAVDRFLEPRLTTPAWPGHVDALINTVATAADHLAPRLTESPAAEIAEADRAEMAATIRTFVNATIPEMVIVGRWLSWDETTI